ncbi:MAG: hypothetical protein ACK6BN_18800, partial [Pseudanabaena sp.]
RPAVWSAVAKALRSPIPGVRRAAFQALPLRNESVALLKQAGVSIALPFFDVVGNGKISGAITDQLTAKLAGQNMQMGNYDPPVLLMPSWFN